MNKMKPFVLIEVRPKIFLLSFNNYYDMTMYFLRYQEFYESPSPKYRGKSFEILDFMKWYSLKYGKGCFTYSMDWGGFNIPGDTIKKVWDLGISDCNKYDLEMKLVYEECVNKCSDDFYIIGAVGKNEALKHEVAHGFFYTSQKYKEEMTHLVKSLNPEFKKTLCNILKNIGYTPKVYIDECQAFLSTGLTPDFDELNITNEHKPFVKLFKSYYEQDKSSAKKGSAK